MKKYKVIYADPPWRYEDKNAQEERGACFKYSVMGTESICSLEINKIADADCVLFLWATFPMLRDALKVMNAWGFDYKTAAFVWVKIIREDESKDFFGLGNWTRANAELVLMGVKGSPERKLMSVRQIVDAPVRRHSEKPDEVRQRIVELMGDVPRIELFARERIIGWDAWGNEVSSDVEIGTNRLVHPRMMI